MNCVLLHIMVLHDRWMQPFLPLLRDSQVKAHTVEGVSVSSIVVSKAVDYLANTGTSTTFVQVGRT